ncbi:hypothetical protein GXY_04884 [Novacetimonas hansenii ATCC 23769]|uniref:Uncharacterized protein n=1 Tax=Novacetimonas hansenii ATCC 23769 TaxID=714995 RepID=D5QCX1_NOVHA|nr:hypothetical protein GXY_04884 [Novacetimonas hansenii ATCC 23769]
MQQNGTGLIMPDAQRQGRTLKTVCIKGAGTI